MPLDFAIMASKKDAAGMNIAGQLRLLHDFPAEIGGSRVGIFIVDDELIHCENIDKQVDAGVFIFASRHVSKANVHSLTVHSIGNWGSAKAGGRGRRLVKCPSALMKQCIKLLVEKASAAHLDYEIVQEATHHGPYLEKPAMFIEIGSDEERWNDKKAGKAVAEAICGAIKNLGSSENSVKAAVGIGGLHYASNFRKVMLSDSFSIAHICPKHELALLDAEMLKQAMDSSMPRASSVIVDWKGLGKEKERVVQLLRSLGISYSRTSEF